MTTNKIVVGMESFTSGIVNCNQRKHYLRRHPGGKHFFRYIGHGKYRMYGWESSIDYARWVK